MLNEQRGKRDILKGLIRNSEGIPSARQHGDATRRYYRKRNTFSSP